MSKVESKELKVKSFRVDESTFSKFKEIASNEFGNQAQCLEALINIYETEEAKGILVGRQLEIESFQDYLNKISRLFTTSLQLSSDAEERAKECFIKKLDSKDEAITVIKSKNDELKEEIIILKKKNKELIDNNSNLETKNTELSEAKNTLSQLANRNFDLSSRLEIEIKDLKLESEKKSDYKAENIELLAKCNTYKRAIDENDLMMQNSEKKSVELEGKLQEMSKISKSKDSEVKSYQALLEAVRREAKVEIVAVENKLKAEYKETLKERIELLNRGFELDKKELELKIKELKIK